MAGAVLLGGACIVPPVARNLARHGVKVCVLNNEVCEARFSRYVNCFLRCPPPKDEEALVEYLVTIAKQKQMEGWVLFASNDEYLRIFKHYRSLLSGYYTLTVPPWEIIRFFYNKRLTYSLAEKIGIPIPETYQPETLDELLSLDIDFPVVLKPAVTHRLLSTVQHKAYRADNGRELQHLYERMCRHIGSSNVIVQEFIPGETGVLFSYAGYFKNGHPVAGLSAKRLRQYPSNFGKLSTFVETITNPELEKLATQLLSSIGYTGLAEIEFMWNENHARFELLEVNPRLWAWHELTLAAGLELPYLAFADAIGKEISFDTARDGTKLIHLFTDIYVAVQEMYLGKLTARRYFASLRGKPSVALFSLKDPLPFMVEACFLLHRALHKLASGKTGI